MNIQSVVANAAIRVARLQERERYEGSLIDFAEYVWPVVEPAIPFIKGWAIEAISEHLEAVTYGHIRRLLINVPPGFTKSLFTDVFWPAWEWGPQNRPTLRYMCAAYSNHLTERDNMRCRNIVISDRYKKMWGDRFKISNEQFTKIKFANDKTGWKLATSVGGIGTGERADRVIIDDPNNPMEMESEAIRENAKMWFTEVIPDRLNNPKESAIVVIQQRTHEEDISGLAISREMGYTHLMIPMYHDPGRHCVTVLGFDNEDKEVKWEDPREEEGELAWPERFPMEVAKGLQRDKGPYAWASQYQQTPEPRGGSIIKRHFWQLWADKKFPSFEYLLASLDTAYTSKDENDASALTIWGVYRDENNNPKIMLVWAWSERLEFHELIQKVIETCTVDAGKATGPRFSVDRLLIEAKASGQSVGQELYRMFRGTGKLGVELINPTQYGDKVARVHSIVHLFADDMIAAPDRDYANKVIDQCAVFPKGSHDDYVDSTSQALRYLRDCGFALKRDEHAIDVEDEMRYISPSATSSLYPC